LAGSTELDTAQTVERVAAPRTVIDALPHRLAEFAVTGDVDAEVFLMTHDVAHRRTQPQLKFPLVGHPASLAGPVRRD
jgi:hypothetical protein